MIPGAQAAAQAAISHIDAVGHLFVECGMKRFILTCLAVTAFGVPLLAAAAASAPAAQKPKKAIPKEAMRHLVMGDTFQKEAKTADDFSLAAQSYQEALALAPSWQEAERKLSAALESAGRFAEAKAVIEHYLLSKPRDAEAAERRIYALDAKIKMAARAPKAAAPVAAPPAKAPVERGATLSCQYASGGSINLRIDYESGFLERLAPSGNAFDGWTVVASIGPNSIRWSKEWLESGTEPPSRMQWEGNIDRLSGAGWTMMDRPDYTTGRQQMTITCQKGTPRF